MRILRGAAWGLVLAFVALGAAAAAADDERLEWRDPQRIDFEGVRSFDPAQMRLTLEVSYDLQKAAHPTQSFETYLAALEEAVRQGYLHAGFATPVIKARPDDSKGRITVAVEEGKRYRSGRVFIGSSGRLPAETLIRRVTEEVLPRYAIAIEAPGPGGTSKTVWVDERGRPKKLLKALWVKGEWAPFDEWFRHEAYARVWDAFVREGFVGATIDMQVVPDEDGLASLCIDVAATGPEAWVDRVTLRGFPEHRQAEVIAFLDVDVGSRIDDGLFARLHHRLFESGRVAFPRVWDKPGLDVGQLQLTVGTLKGASAAPSESADAAVRLFELLIGATEVPGAPPLASPPTPIESTLRSARDWLRAWGDDPEADDLVLEGIGDVAAMFGLPDHDSGNAGNEMVPGLASLAGTEARFRLVLGPRRGAVLDLSLLDAAGKTRYGQTILLRGDEIAFFSPGRQTRLDLVRSPGLGFLVRSRLYWTSLRSAESSGFGFEIEPRFHLRRDGANPGICAEWESDPAALFLLSRMPWFAPPDKPGHAVLETEGWKIELDSRRGMPVRIDYRRENGGIAAHWERGALDRAWERCDRDAAQARRVDGRTSPFPALLDYAADEMAQFVRQCLPPTEHRTYAALAKLVHRTSPLIETAMADVIAPECAEGQFAAPAVRGTPGSRWFLSTYDPSTWNSTAAGEYLFSMRRVLPRDGWLWPVARDWLLQSGTDAKANFARASLLETLNGPGAGPIAKWIRLEYFNDYSRGLPVDLEVMSPAAFRSDYLPLISGDGALSRSLLAVVEVLREFDEADLTALARLLPRELPVEEMVKCLMTLKAEPSRPARELLPKALDRLWMNALREDLSLILGAF